MAIIRSGLKCVAFCLAYALVSPLVVLCKLHELINPGFHYNDYGTLLALIPTELGRQLRGAFYLLTLRRAGRSLTVGFGSYFVYPDAEVGHYFDCGAYCVIGKCRIGDHVILASRVSIISGRHQHGSELGQMPMQLQRGIRQLIEIGSNVWIGEGATVAAGVGDDCIIGAGAVVVQPVEAGCVAAGNPARVIRQRRTAITAATD